VPIRFTKGDVKLGMPREWQLAFPQVLDTEAREALLSRDNGFHELGSHEGKGDLTTYVPIGHTFSLSQFAHRFDASRHKRSKPGVSARKGLEKRWVRWASPRAAIAFGDQQDGR
jgi:hypothetical protein